MSQDPRAPLASALGEAQVADVMSSPLVTCPPSVPLWEVAQLMTRNRIHAVVVEAGPPGPGDAEEQWGVISELDLVGAASLADPEVPAGLVAATPAVVVGPDESLERAAMLMAEYQVTHLIAVAEGRPSGIVSALDLARALSPPAQPAEAPAPRPASDVLSGASPGDRLVISAHQLGGPERDAEILEARGEGGGPPFLVRWEDSGRVSLLYPGSDARIESTRSP
ncbi:MAG TPA: CBS domain-containing protein [Miltoncostaeaceae bacterium]|nr:CBS domain-containing protein [Miltoncostaeaceae bacterium]